MKKSKLFIYGFFLLIISAFLLISSTGQKYEAKKRPEIIMINNNSIIPGDVILRFCNLKNVNENKNLTSEIVLDRILKYPLIKEVSGEYKDSIHFVVEVKEEQPAFLINLDNELEIITEERNVVKLLDQYNIKNIPIISGLPKDMIDNHYSEFMKKIEYAFYIKNQFEKVSTTLYELLSEINYSDDKIYLYFNEPKSKILIDETFNSSVVNKMKDFFFNVGFYNVPVHYAHIDARFEDQIITIEKSIKDESK